MDIGYYAKPETWWGFDHVTSCYSEDKEVSRNRIVDQLISKFPDATMDSIVKEIGK